MLDPNVGAYVFQPSNIEYDQTQMLFISLQAGGRLRNVFKSEGDQKPFAEEVSPMVPSRTPHFTTI